MSKQIDPMPELDDPAPSLAVVDGGSLEGLADRLVAQARASGIALTGPGGLLTGLTKQVLETALNAEMAEDLSHEHG